MFCGMCGKEIQEGWLVCPHCGNSLSKKENIREQTMTVDKKQKVKLLWIVMGIIGAALLFLTIVVEKIPRVSEEESAFSKSVESESVERVEKAEVESESVERVENVEVDYSYIYGGALDSMLSEYSGAGEYYFEYTFYDIDKDGYSECIILNGTCVADMVYDVYTTDGSKAVWVDEMIGGGESLYQCPEKNGLYKHFANMGYEILTFVSLESGKLIQEVIYEGESEEYGKFSELETPIEMIVQDKTNEDNYNVKTPLEVLKENAYDEWCAKGVLNDHEYMADVGFPQYATSMEDDGSYFDEVILGTWFDEEGNPIAGQVPDRLDSAIAYYDGNVSSFLENFKFINGQDYTMDMLKRTSPDERVLYAMVIEDISKQEDIYGNIYMQGMDYITNTPVIIHGNFSKILNGDDLLVFAEYMGLASDDTPNFNGVFIEIINGRLINQY